VKLSGVFDQLPSDRSGRQVYGEPFETADGATVIPVAAPVGVFVVHRGEATWVPAQDPNRIALIGVTTGLVAAVIAALAVLRQPPWPKITITD
jgi:hypothetical protein